jgi:predicted ArsR family transcriptional regulator
MPDRPPAVALDAEQRHVALAVRSRRRLLELLRATGGPTCAGELAAAVGLHVTTARAHLRVLEAAGLVVRTRRPPTGPGRPTQFYAPAVVEGAGDGHGQLAELLAGALDDGGEEGRRRAEGAGRRWAQHEVPDPAHLPWEQAVGGIAELFARVGFAPRRVEAGRPGFQLALDRCPFRDVARAHPDIVCALHLGLMREALSRFGQPGIAASAHLQPFVAPDLCVAGIPGLAGAGRVTGSDRIGEK